MGIAGKGECLASDVASRGSLLTSFLRAPSPWILSKARQGAVRGLPPYSQPSQLPFPLDICINMLTMLRGLPHHLEVGFRDLTAQLTKGCRTNAQLLIEFGDG